MEKARWDDSEHAGMILLRILDANACDSPMQNDEGGGRLMLLLP